MVAAQAFIGPVLPPDWSGRGPSSTESSAVEAYGALTGLKTEPDGRIQLQMEFDPSEQIEHGHGLVNLGNSCFMAATVQCLTHLAPFANLSLTNAHQKVCEETREEKTFCAACGLYRRIFAGLMRNSLVAVHPKHMWSHLQEYAEHFTRGQQEDAHEFLLCCLDAVERDCLTLYKRLSSLPVKPGQEPKTEVAEFTTTDKLEGANLYSCEKCKRHVVAEKRVTVHQSPNVLVLHLQRFSLFAKINRQIDFPAELDLGPCLPLLRLCPSTQRWPLVVHE
ncbi:hypothetical protein WJX73_005377 [Symbiochloris irregularis]|uniref:ubiquitinyl hydrolase 1 n=1 Tax=Symbiochloris irregularis TaxID=706552 RepID=A0AAW1NRX0_9CHLO